MSASPQILAFVLANLAHKFDEQTKSVQKERKQLAKDIRELYKSSDIGCDGDFNDNDLDCYEELVTLGLAEKCKICKKGYTEWSEDCHGIGLCKVKKK